MKATDCVKLESDKKFKRQYLDAADWAKSILLVPSICFIFVGLFGVVYLLNLGQLASWYVIPYAAFFVIGTIWFKAIKRHLQDKALTHDGSFLICMASPAGRKDGYIRVVFTTADKRHNEYFISNLTKSLDEDSFSDEEVKKSKKMPVKKYDEQNNTDYYMRTFFHTQLARRNVAWDDGNAFPLLYISPKHVEVVRKRDMDEAGI